MVLRPLANGLIAARTIDTDQAHSERARLEKRLLAGIGSEPPKGPV